MVITTFVGLKLGMVVGNDDGSADVEGTNDGQDDGDVLRVGCVDG